MLRQLRHISEGHYYGLRVTNNAEVEHLNKELRTLDACKNVQNHCYRKEEKDLVNTLKRLKKSKDHHVEEHFGRRQPNYGHDSGHFTTNGHSAPKQFPFKQSSGHPAAAQTVGSSLRIPQARKPLPEPVVMPAVGSEVHRTTGFIDCVICNLRRSSHIKGTDVCTCEKGPDKGTHHMHPPAIHDDKSRAEYLSPKERRELEMQKRKLAEEHDEIKQSQKKVLDHEDRMFLNRLHQEMIKVIEQPSGIPPRDFTYDKRAHSPRKGDSAYEEKGHFFPKPRRGSQLDDERFRVRQDNIDEEGPYTVWNRHRRESVEENDVRKRGPSFDYGIRERNESVGGESYYSVGELRSRTSTMEDTVFRKTFKIPYNVQDSPSPPTERQVYQSRHSDHRFSPPEETHLPQLTPQKKEATEVFHGLIHPDNIINHHHYLPYEADKLSSKRRHRDEHHKDNVHGYYIHKYDHTGARQIAHIPLGAHMHIAEMIERQHEPNSHHFAILSNLRQLLSVYHRLEDAAPKYPWPSPPKAEITPEEFQRLKDCRYLRLPKSMEDVTIESPLFH